MRWAAILVCSLQSSCPFLCFSSKLQFFTALFVCRPDAFSSSVRTRAAIASVRGGYLQGGGGGGENG